MRGVIVHGVLLAGALVLSYWAWTADEHSSQDRDEVTIWSGSPDDVVALSYEREDQTLNVDRRRDDDGTYLWGTLRRPILGSDSAGTDSQDERVEEFPIGERGDDLLGQIAPLMGMRDLGVLDDSSKADFELETPERRLTVTFAERIRELLIGGSVFGGGHRYALDPETGRGYVVSSSVLRRLEGGQGALRLTRLHEFDERDVGAVTVRSATGDERRMLRGGRDAGSAGEAEWLDPESGEPDQTFANFMDRIERLAVITYEGDVPPDSLALRVRIDYEDGNNRPLGFTELYRRRSEAADGFEYFLRTELTRILARAHPSIGERVDEDLEEVL